MPESLKAPLKEIEYQINRYFKRYNGEPREGDFELNFLTSQIPHAMLTELGQCYLGKINLYKEDIKPHKLTKYETDNQVNLYNFSFDFCIPVYDPVIEKMINDRANFTGHYNGSSDMKKIKTIHKRINELKGVVLVWS